METLFIGRNTIFLPEVDSTNSYAISLLKNVNLAEGTAVYTKNQTNGRGQRGNVWNTEPERNIAVSIILKPGFLELKKNFFLYKIAALACHDVMAEILGSSHFDIKIKWPNDILVNSKKIAGILIENNISNNQIAQSIVGIGMNVNQEKFDASFTATSILLESGQEHQPELVMQKLFTHLEKHYLRLKNNLSDKIKENYLDRFFKRGEWQEFEVEEQIQQFLVKGTGSGGLLVLEDKAGNEREFDVKEVKWKF